MKSFGWKRKSTQLCSNVAFSEGNDHKEEEPKELDWVEKSRKQRKLDSTQQKLSEEKRINLLKEEGISYIERDCPWQAIGRWDEALDIKLPSGSTPKDFGHEKILDMKAQALISLHEWEPAIETSYFTLKIEPNWWPAHQTLGRAYLGFGKLQQAVNSFSRAVHLCPDNEELRFEDLSWAHDLLLREKLGNREWKPIKDPEPKGEDSDEEYMIEEDGERTKILPTSFRP